MHTATATFYLSVSSSALWAQIARAIPVPRAVFVMEGLPGGGVTHALSFGVTLVTGNLLLVERGGLMGDPWLVPGWLCLSPASPSGPNSGHDGREQRHAHVDRTAGLGEVAVVRRVVELVGYLIVFNISIKDHGFRLEMRDRLD